MSRQDQRSADDASAPGGAIDVMRFRWLEDHLVETYVQWREACTDVRQAYELWERSPREHGGGTFAVYFAALDQEECAARAHCDSVALLSAHLTGR